MPSAVANSRCRTVLRQRQGGTPRPAWAHPYSRSSSSLRLQRWTSLVLASSSRWRESKSANEPAMGTIRTKNQAGGQGTFRYSEAIGRAAECRDEIHMSRLFNTGQDE
uniref:Uncharacterized protein n=1 Tax=Calcidiscus leptoporus TaxID=127549 RepID=A0A7S0P1U3_9EUKA|mmetsp:Transcript_49864/g.115107  ORF Transcript_49864/g.115107 Transcript_49864/m.115107 type:complete len:108 (+) Transcript_49864:103-426(+)